MAQSGIARRIDHLGRVVVPIELRRNLGIADGDLVDISLDGGRIVLEKVQQACVFCGAAEGLRPHRSKLVCRACVDELGQPPSGDGSRVATS
jgi:transcriptional pleiotropic regulator of transition state genes